MKSFKKPVAVRRDVTTLYPGTNAVFSPDEKFVVTGVGASSKGGVSKLVFLRREDLSAVRELEMESTPVKVIWHPKINQVLQMFFFGVWELRAEMRVDPGGAIERAGVLSVLTREFRERCKAAWEQECGAESDGGDGGGEWAAAYDFDAACASDVPGWGGGEECEAEAGEGEAGPEEEQEA